MRSLNVLADPTRQRIVELLAVRSLCSGEIASQFEVSAPAISQHLKTLRQANLVQVRRDGQRRIYELNRAGVNELAEWIDRIRGFWSPKLDALERAISNGQKENER